MQLQKKTDRNWAKIIIREKILIIEEIFNSPLRSSFTYVHYEIGSVSKNFLHIMDQRGRDLNHDVKAVSLIEYMSE